MGLEKSRVKIEIELERNAKTVFDSLCFKSKAIQKTLEGRKLVIEFCATSAEMQRNAYYCFEQVALIQNTVATFGRYKVDSKFPS